MTPMPEIIAHDQTLEEAGNTMIRLAVRHLPVVRRGKLAGVISQRDIAVADALGKKGRKHTVEETMDTVPFTCGPDAHLHAVAAEMAERKIGSAIVVKVESPLEVVGVFTTVDACRALAELSDHAAPETD